MVHSGTRPKHNMIVIWSHPETNISGVRLVFNIVQSEIRPNQIKQWFNQGCTSPDRGVTGLQAPLRLRAPLRLQAHRASFFASGEKSGIRRRGGLVRASFFRLWRKKVGGGMPDLPLAKKVGAASDAGGSYLEPNTIHQTEAYASPHRNFQGPEASEIFTFLKHSFCLTGCRFFASGTKSMEADS